jgi:NAD(P)-dependent dehydrogenase (short-subunit alcohol dehydrogenase family)
LYKGDIMFTERVAVVTGGSRGIGLAIARVLLARGARVAITATSDVTLRAATEELEQIAGSAAVLAIRADVRRYEEVEQAFAVVARHFGGIDAVVNNAGVGVFRPVADMTLEEWRQVIDTNISGVFHGCRAAVPHMRTRGGGWIINVSSLSSTNAFPDGAAYCASKAAVNAFSEAFMQEVRHDGIRVAYVLPGSVRTDFMGRSSSGGDDWKLAPDDVAQVVVDLMAHPTRSLPSRVDIRPARPPKKR